MPKGWWYHRESTVSVAEDLSHCIELTDLTEISLGMFLFRNNAMVDRQKAFYCIWSAKCPRWRKKKCNGRTLVPPKARTSLF
jgi:hypothetical protein